jgi:S-DNA-T family DNA segregation ATPase FtsK/SpoIIIE
MNFTLENLTDREIKRMSKEELAYHCKPITDLIKRKRLPLEVVEVADNASMIKIDLENFGNIELEKCKKELESIYTQLPNSIIKIVGNRLIVIFNKEKNIRQILPLKRILNSEAYYFYTNEDPEAIPICLGETVENDIIIKDLRELVHILIAGTTGSGKSILLHTILACLMYRMKPEDLQLVLIDLKMVELVFYEDSPYLAHPICRETDKVIEALESLCHTMQERYKILRKHRVRNIASYNKLPDVKKMPYIVVVIDEFADLILSSKSTKCEQHIVRLAQKARACGIHLILATQKPTVDICTGLIKANMPTRIALAVATHADSMVILDETGAEKLSKKGDMIIKTDETIRLQCPYISEQEIESITKSIIETYGTNDFTEYETVSDNEISLPFKPLTTRKKEGDTHEGKVVLGDDIYHFSLKAIEENRASKTYCKKVLGGGERTINERMERMQRFGIIGDYDERKYTYPILIKFDKFLECFISESEVND